ncbi:acylneuraminate cytidylyltransferase [Sphingomonas sp. NFR15]|uniref:acylneuraminate cytidylyltransferase n=1 Tax=Sphingomonas sp. NFR15 TaxID=1566282 RepID=UPI000888600A|nr:acylneuraminate cytidylyltransferase [Sphingomonas sp. NFR15]SDA36739.1 3-deoxy-D-manno-octulosonate 8-phosphate phosphatase, YrbI family [Sphingomonas sp. NFR15]
MQTLAIIPARGGSKGIPRKNVLPLGGVPLIAHSIHAARAASRVDRVVVSTDDDEIASVARRYGAEVVRRPAELASDTASSEAALLHTLDALREGEGYEPDLLVFLQCTSPLTAPEDIDGTIAALIDRRADSALAVTPFHYFLWGEDADGAHGVNHDKSVRLMRQQRTPEYLETGAVYVMKTEGFRAARHRFFGKTVLFDTPIERRLEIDEPADFRIAEERIARLTARAPGLPPRVSALVMDFDGVLTDDRVFVSETGEESVVCSRRDGMGIERLRAAGLPMLVISKETNPVVAARCRKLRLPYQHGIEGKLAVLQAWLAEHAIDPAETLYVGNDVNDLECMAAVGCAVAPQDAHPRALAAAALVLDADGGRGAIRLLADLLEAGGHLARG